MLLDKVGEDGVSKERRERAYEGKERVDESRRWERLCWW